MKNYFFLALLSVFLVSCSSVKGSLGFIQYDRVYPLTSTCVLKNTLWGDWGNIYSHKVTTKYNKEYLYIYIYKNHEHPSNYDIKITINKSSKRKRNDDFMEYTGSAEISKNNLIDYGSLKDEGVRPCTILCDKSMTKSINKNGLFGVINILYNDGNGRGFTFR